MYEKAEQCYDANGIPLTYTKLEYLESTGTQYIDTGINAQTGLKFESEFVIPVDNSRDNILFGARSNSLNTRYWFDIDWENTDNFKLGYNVYNHLGYQDILDIYENKKIKINLNIMENNTTFYINDVLIDTLEYNYNVNLGMNIYLFRANYSSSYPISTKLYKFKIWDSEDTLLLNLIPCYRKSDSVIGMYDTVEGKFYTNQGTGTFLKGNDV